ncbi:hypothetical protein H5410_040770, partial [Solanum commersonii]
MYTTRLNLLMQASNVHSKFQVVTYHYQKISSSQYLLQMKFKSSELDATLTLTKKNTMHNFTRRFDRIFESTLVSAHSRSKWSFQG